MKKHRNKKGQYITDPTFRVCAKWSMILITIIAVLVLVGVNFKRSAEALKSIGRELSPIHNVSAKSEVTEIQSMKSFIDAKIDKVAQKYGVSAYQMKRTVKCESNYQNKQSEVMKNGIRENSWGIFQIHLDSHPEVSKAQALDIDFAIDWAARHWNSVAWYGYIRKTDKCNI